MPVDTQSPVEANQEGKIPMEGKQGTQTLCFLVYTLHTHDTHGF